MPRPKTARRESPVGRRPGGTESRGRGQLLDTAIVLFAERGIGNTTVAQIARASRVTSAMVHYWFDNRERLLDAVVEERLAPLINRIWDVPSGHQEQPLEVLRGLVVRMLDVTEQVPWLPALWLREIIQEGGLLRERVLKYIPRERNAEFRRNVQRAQQRGEINRDINPDLLFISILGLVMLPMAASKSWQRYNPGAALDRAQLERHVIAVMMHGLAESAPKRPARARAMGE